MRAIFDAAAAAGLGQPQPAAGVSGQLPGAAHVSAGGSISSGMGRSGEPAPPEDEQAQRSAVSGTSSANEAANELTMKDMPATAAVAVELARLSAGAGGGRDADRETSVHFRPRQELPQAMPKPKASLQNRDWQ